jgi:hypothetical protein
MKICIACGMPMQQKSDFAMGDENKDYCKYCARTDGTMQSYDEKLEGMSEFFVKTQGLDKEVAKKTAVQVLSKLPAWQNKV